MVGLADLPSEVIYEIVRHLPTAQAITSLSQTCRHLHNVIAAEDSRMFKAFLKCRFPHIEAPMFPREATQSLTSRSRALDRHAVFGRLLAPPPDAIRLKGHGSERLDNPTIGYRPVIDSYEVWNGETWADRKEVLAWGAGAELRVRIQQFGKGAYEKWFLFNDRDHVRSYDDICGLKLITHKLDCEDQDNDVEHLIFGRMYGDIVHIAISPNLNSFNYVSRFSTDGRELLGLDVSEGPEPILAAHCAGAPHSAGGAMLFGIDPTEAVVEPFLLLPNDPSVDSSHLGKYSKFLSSSRFAFATGDIEESLTIVDLTKEQTAQRVGGISVADLDLDGKDRLPVKSGVSSISTLGAQTGDVSGNVFLAAWGDHQIRLHDLRSGNPYEYTYKDSNHCHPIYAVQAFGHGHFLAGAGADAVLKIFDLRMQNSYDYREANGPSVPRYFPNVSDETARMGLKSVQDPSRFPRQDFTIFLPGFRYNRPGQGGRYNRTPFPDLRYHRLNENYRGAVYSLSCPSAMSPTVYTGVENGVIRLDFTATDDLMGPCADWYLDSLSLGTELFDKLSQTIDLCGYEQPLDARSTSLSKLHRQRAVLGLDKVDVWHELVTCWDRRWFSVDNSGSGASSNAPMRARRH